MSTYSATLHKHLLDNLNIGVALLDERCTVCYLNPAAEMLLGVALPRIFGLDFSSLITDNSTLSLQLQSVLNTQQITSQRAAEWETSFTGQPMVVDYTITALQNGPEIQILVEIERVDRWLKISQEEAMQAAHDTGRSIVRGMAHEIKNPLGGIKGATQLLAKELIDPEHHEFSNIIIEEANRLRNLVDKMLGPRHLPNLQSQNLHEVIEHVLALIQSENGEKLTIKRDYDPSIPVVYIDREQLIQALINLVKNAVNAMLESNTPSPVLTLKSRVVKRHRVDSMHSHLMACIDIGDNGPGVPDHLKETLFFPMITGSASGMGLGLSITQSIVHQHKGTLDFASQRGDTHFLIYLPIEEKDV